MSQMPNDETLHKMEATLNVASDFTRLKILYCIDYEEKSVGEIVSALGVSQSLVSHQLDVLKKAHLVSVRKEGRKVFYKLDDYHVNALLSVVRDHVEEADE